MSVYVKLIVICVIYIGKGPLHAAAADPRWAVVRGRGPDTDTARDSGPGAARDAAGG